MKINISVKKSINCVILLVCILTSGCTRMQKDVVQVENKLNKMDSGNGLEIYLVKEGQTTSDSSIKLDDLELEEEALLSKSNVVSYKWDVHTLKVINDGKVNKGLLGRAFVATVDGERIFRGAFWSAAFTTEPPEIAVYLGGEDKESPYLFLSLGSWAPNREVLAKAGQFLNNEGLKTVLERDGLLYERYQPLHFTSPDNISFSEKGRGCEFAEGVDWQLKDKLLMALDKRLGNSLNKEKNNITEEEVGALCEKEQILTLLYNDTPQKLKYTIENYEKEFEYTEIIFPISGEYENMIILRGADHTTLTALGNLEEFEDFSLINEGTKRINYAMINSEEPQPPYIAYFEGRPFSSAALKWYKLNEETAKEIKKQLTFSTAIEFDSDEVPGTYSLFLRYGTGTDEWFYVQDDEKTLFSAGKAYRNSELNKKVIDICEKGFGFKVLRMGEVKGITEAKYSFRTNTRTFESTIKDPVVLARLEGELQKAKVSMGGACPFSDGVLTLTLVDGSLLEFQMASDDCPGMFINGSYYDYSKELHDIFKSSFDNFPYVTAP